MGEPLFFVRLFLYFCTTIVREVIGESLEVIEHRR